MDGEIPSVWGINLNAASPPPEALRIPFVALASKLEALLAPAGIYVQPFHALHITVASLVPFSSNSVATCDRAALTTAWIKALQETCTPEHGFPDAPGELVFERPTLERAAAIFRVSDPAGLVARARACVRKAYDSHPALRALAGPGTPLEASDFRMPAIVHSSIMRFVARHPVAATDLPTPTMSDDEIRAAFESAAAAWVPVRVPFDRISVVLEDVPFMHSDLAGRDRAKVLAELVFGRTQVQ